MYDDTWRLDLASDAPAWTRLDAMGPGARYDAVLVSVGDDEPLLLFGGAASAVSGFSAEIWRFDPAEEDWTEVLASGGPVPGRRAGWLALEPDHTGFLVGFGLVGIQPDEVLADLWRFDLVAERWEELTPAEGPAGRGLCLHVPGGPGSAGLLLGGYDGDGPGDDAWRLSPPTADARW